MQVTIDRAPFSRVRRCFTKSAVAVVALGLGGFADSGAQAVPRSPQAFQPLQLVPENTQPTCGQAAKGGRSATNRPGSAQSTRRSVHLGNPGGGAFRTISLTLNPAGRIVGLDDTGVFIDSTGSAVAFSARSNWDSAGAVIGFRTKPLRTKADSAAPLVRLDSAEITRVRALAEWLKRRCEK